MEGENSSQTDIPTKAINLARQEGAASFFQDQRGGCFSRIKVVDHFEIYNIDKEKYRNWLNQLYFTLQKKVLSRESLSSALGTLKGMASFGGEFHPLELRVANHRLAKREDLDLSKMTLFIRHPKGEGSRARN